MRTTIVRILAAAGILLATFVLVILVDFAFFRGTTPAIDAAAAVASLETVKLGGAEQWILIRGHDSTRPVVLFLHGGPGMPAMYLAHAFQRRLEERFVVVHWDRRGAGKSYEAGLDGDITVRQTLDDTFELTRLLLDRFAKERLYLVGHSWGSYLGMLAISEHPEYYAAFVGTGQLAMGPERNEAERRQFLLRRAQETGDTEMADRMRADPARVTEDDLFRYGAELHDATSFLPILMEGLRAPEYSFSDAINVKKGADFVNEKMVYDVIAGPLSENVRQVHIPVFFFLGRYDYTTPSNLAAEYLDSLSCPLKGLVWFEHSAHFPFYEEPERFQAELTKADSLTTAYWRGAQEDIGASSSRDRMHGTQSRAVPNPGKEGP